MHIYGFHESNALKNLHIVSPIVRVKICYILSILLVTEMLSISTLLYSTYYLE